MLYDLAIGIYDLLVHLAAPFSRKPRKMMKGHWVVYELLRQQLEKDVRYIWFHAASLGEFEQGRPLIEKIRAKYPDYGILLTFFSPSGYEVRKNYRGADVVCYLPFDKPRNVKKFLDIANPCMAFFIKYEFWKNYLDELHKRRIPVYSVSSIFRRGQVFFKWYGGTYRHVLRNFDHLFVQNERSKRYLSKIGINRVTVVGDTRFDRVLQIREEAKELPLVKLFKNNTMTFVAGSSWQPDEDLFIEYFNNHPEVKLIIAPHVIDENHLVEIIRKLKRPYVRYTRADEKNVLKADCLIIDCFGLLSSIYRYGEIAYIGGGFGVGIHNTLEAAVYGIPVIFGPKYQKFMEAIQLLEAQGAFSIKNYEELKELFRVVRGTKIEFPVIMAAYYGLRRSEIVGLKWSAVDFNYKTIQIRHTVTNSVTDGKYILIKKNRTKTQKSLRTLPLFANVEQMLLQMKDEQEHYKELFGNSYDYTDSEYVYVHENGKLIDPGYITQHFGIVLRNNGLRKIRFHDLRHSCATLLRHNGARMEDIQRWLGHSTIGTTEKIYAHFEEEEHLISAGRIAKALQPDSDNPDERSLPAPKGKSDFEM